MLVDVVQYLPPDPIDWTFAPNNEWIAAPLNGGCALWDIESGIHLGRWTDESIDPCADWSSGHLALSTYGIHEQSSDRALTATIDGARVEIRAGEQLQRTLSCSRCAAVLGLDWANQGHRLVLVRDGGRVELWDADSGRRESSFDARPRLASHESIASASVGWSSLGTAVGFSISKRAKRSKEWDYPFDVRAQIQLWTEAGKRVHTFDTYDELGHAFSDPGGQWLFVLTDDPNPRAELGQTLHVHPLGTRESKLWWEDWDRSVPEPAFEYETQGGRWRDDSTTTWLAAYAESYDYADTDNFGVAVLRTEPQPLFERIELDRHEQYEIALDDLDIEVFGHAEGRAIASWLELVEGNPPLRHSAAGLPSDCELVDVSPDLAGELLRCNDGLRLRRPTTDVHVLGSSSKWAWGRGGWLALEDHGRVAVFDPSGELVLERDNSNYIHGKGLVTADLLALRHEGALELVSLAKPGQPKTVLRVEHSPTDVALSPDGRRVAVLGQLKLRIFALEPSATDEPTLLVRIESASGSEVAFDQLGRLVFTGNATPQHAWNSWTGALASGATPRLPDGELDPSWRWLVSGHDYVVRTIDGLGLRIGPDFAMLDDGRFIGSPPGQYTRDRHFRVGQALAVPSCGAAQLERWLVRPTLIEDFFAGRPIAPVTIPEAEAAKLPCHAGP